MTVVKTNFVQIKIDNAMIEVGSTLHYDKDLHRALEDEHGADYVFRRRGNTLEAIRINPDAKSLDMKFELRPVKQIGKFLNILIERGLERHVIRPNISLVRRKPLTVVSLDPKYDLAHTLFEERGPSPLHVRRGFRMEARTVFRKDGPTPAIVIDAITHSDLGNTTCAELIHDGFDLRGLYVLSLDPADTKQGRPALVGQVAEVHGTTIHLGPDRRGERSTYDASILSLDLGPVALPRLATHYIGKDAHEEIWGERNHLATGSQRWNRISRFVENISGSSFEIAPSIKAQLSDWIPGSELGQTTAKFPTFIFGGNKLADSTRGLFRSGPYYVNPKSEIHVQACVICEHALRSEVEGFLKALNEGEGSHRPLKLTWKIGAIGFTIFESASSSATDYERAFQAAIDHGIEWQLALVQVPSNTQDSFGNKNPYLVTKAKFLTRRIPVQEFRVETMSKPIAQRQWALGGIGLQVFTKLGGVPWLLKSNDKIHELVFGLGSASLGTTRCGERDRVVGLTTAFSGDGLYYLTETSRTVKYEEHEDAVIESAISAFKRVRTDLAWRDGDSVRIVFHSFKDLREQHIDGLKNAILAAAGNRQRVDFSFLHLAEHHPILLFDTKEEQHIPPRGIVIQMGKYEVLLSALGPNEVRNDRIGFPRPIYMKLQKGSTFSDLSYLSNQTLAFASLSWRNFTPTSIPVTILYAELIANLLGRLGSLPHWDPDTLRGEVGISRWFL